VAPEEPGLSEELARSILGMRFTDEAQATIRSLLDKNNQGRLTELERDALQRYLRVGQFIDLLQAKARLSLQSTSRGA
jgi:hypothetical protein